MKGRRRKVSDVWQRKGVWWYVTEDNEEMESKRKVIKT